MLSAQILIDRGEYDAAIACWRMERPHGVGELREVQPGRALVRSGRVERLRRSSMNSAI